MRAGIDLGGTKIEAILMDSAGAIRARTRIPTPKSYPDCLAALESALAEGERQAGARAARIGVGIPGSPSAGTGLVRNANSTWLNGRPFAQDLERALGRPVRAANDANCFALSEATDGAGAGAASVFGVILGTGCGGGVVVDGRLLQGRNGVGGEWGHNPLPWARADEHPGPACWCGKTSCLETWVSGPGLEEDHVRRGGAPRSAAEIAAADDALSRAAMAAHADRLARGLASVVNVIDPDVIVLGGGVSNAPNIAARVEALLPAYVFSDVVRTQVVRNMHGDSSGVRGAAWLWSAD
ncbi:MAG: ROK family protein [Alphaproteobacteria bacterium]|nr:ROK family protein [Alphaproteobacteria bacterium]